MSKVFASQTKHSAEYFGDARNYWWNDDFLALALRRWAVVDVSVCLNEKACPLIPPYTTPRERAILEEITDWAQRDFWIWSRSDTVRYFVAGGGQENDFAHLWKLAMELRRRVKEAVVTCTLACAGGALFYLIAGRKPGTGIAAPGLAQTRKADHVACRRDPH